MTTINLIYMSALSFLVAVGAWGLGKSRKETDPMFKLSVGSGAVEPVKLISESDTVSAPEAAGTEGSVTRGSVEKEFNDLKTTVELELSFDVFRGNPEAFEQALEKIDIGGLKKVLLNPEENFKSKILSREQLLQTLRPKNGESFQASAGGKDIKFVWVEAVDAEKCWFSMDEMDIAPPESVSIAGVIDLPCKSPTVKQWLAARKVAKDGSIKDLDGGKGEYLRGGKVIGRSNMATDPKWEVEVDAGELKKQTMQKVFAEKVEISEAKLDPRFSGLTGAAAVRDNSGLLKQIQRELQKKANDEAVRNVPIESFSYRWVIEPPLP